MKLFPLLVLPIFLMSHCVIIALLCWEDLLKSQKKPLPIHNLLKSGTKPIERRHKKAVRIKKMSTEEEPFNLRAFMKQTSYLERYLLLHRHLYHLYIHDTKLPSFLAEEWDKKVNTCFMAIDESVETRSKAAQDKILDLIHESMKEMDELMRGPIHDQVVKRVDKFQKSRK